MKDLVKIWYSKPTLVNCAEAVVEIYGSSLVGGVPARDKAWHRGVQWAFYMLDGELYNTARQEDVITLPYSKLVQIMEELQSWHMNK